MVKPQLLAFAFLGLMLSQVLYGQKKWEKSPVTGQPVVCTVSGESGHAYVRPSPEFLNRLKSGKRTSQLIAQYVNVPDSIKPAVEYALDIWEFLLSSEIPVYIRIHWEILGKNTLGNCGASNYYQNFEGAPLKDTYYPVATVEKLTGKEMSGSGDPDMVARFNKNIPWYVGTDGKTPVDKYDLVTIVLHEITHGLGFNGFFEANTSARTASYGFDDESPSIYDRFVENSDAKRLTDQAFFNNNSNDLYRAITSNLLYSSGPVTLAWNGNERARLYAPSIYSSGSSIYHLNDFSYGYGNINALMTSAVGAGEAIHSPGPLSSGMLADFGWKHLYIDFTPLKDREEPADSIPFTARIESDLGIKANSACLVYSHDSFKSHRDTVRFKPVVPDGTFRALIPSGKSAIQYTYYLSVQDSTGRTFRAPYNYPDSVYGFSVGPDVEKPVILHQPLKFVMNSVKTFTVTASVTDNLGVDSVGVVFYDKGLEFRRIKLVKTENDLYSGGIELRSLTVENSDSIRYSIEATDLSKFRNLSRQPQKGYYAVSLEKVKGPVVVYSTDFETMPADFVLTDFRISRESGFDNYALHTPHPYPSPERDNDSIELVSVLKVPVILQQNGKMSFDEVVLVEPGEEGALYGSSGFYDYVIVEGSKDGGNRWFPLLDGYDSGSQDTWLTTYYRQMNGNNSLSSGTRTQFVTRRIDLTGNGRFKAGDTLLIRFRLYSDPYAYGWGWAIDQLNIQNNLLTAGSGKLPDHAFTLWPNPALSGFSLRNNLQETLRQITVEMVDVTGRIFHREKGSHFSPGQVLYFDVSAFPPGIYFVILNTEEGLSFHQKVIKPKR